ncbi:MAG: T9SS type A sorting domain-containing protein [candidate division Zixibacteria bacterium]|nr:T9SS type A sorting domain-containing protein [candidate division Zixibacteria bacterium]
MKNCLLKALIVLMIIPTLAVAQFDTFPGVVRVDNVEAMPGTQFGVAVRLTGNTLGIAGLQLPLRFESPYLTVDSVSFGGSLKKSGMETSAQIDNQSDTLSISYYPNYSSSSIVSIDAPGGVLATVYFSLSIDAPTGLIEIDSVYHGNSEVVWSGIGFVDTEGMGIHLPQEFVSGGIVVLSPTAVEDGDEVTSLPARLNLAQNYPNPFNPTTLIEFSLPQAGLVRLEVFNVLGQRVAMPIDKSLGAGMHTIEYDASSQPSGIYFYRITQHEKTETKKMILVK